jgi:hypothetical protein
MVAVVRVRVGLYNRYVCIGIWSAFEIPCTRLRYANCTNVRSTHLFVDLADAPQPRE